MSSVPRFFIFFCIHSVVTHPGENAEVKQAYKGAKEDGCGCLRYSCSYILQACVAVEEEIAVKCICIVCLRLGS